MRRRIQIAIGVLSFSATAHASGFHIDEQDARSTGRGGAVTANPTSAAATYYNPAGIGELQGFHLDFGASLIAPRARFTSAVDGSETSAEAKDFLLPQLYASYRINDVVGVGLGFNAPFGLSLQWPASSPGRAIVREITLDTYFITPTIGINLSRWAPGLSFGAGLDLVPASVKLERDILFGTDVGSARVAATAFGVGARAGILYRPKGLDELSFGLTYRSPVKLNFSGTANFDAPAAYRASLPPDGDAKTSIVLPQTLDFGIAVNPVPAWQIEVDADWLGWSSFDALTLHLPANQTNSLRRDWKNTYAIRVGTEYTVQKWWSARLGFIWDQDPVPSTTLDFQLPDANRFDVAMGLGAAFNQLLRADLAALYVFPAKHKTSSADPYQPPVKGEYDVHAWVLNLSIGLTLDPAHQNASAQSRKQLPM